MKLFKNLCIIAVATLVLSSCGQQAEKLQTQVDSLQNALAERNNDYVQLHDFITVISNGLDSIAIQENTLLARNPESPIPNKEQMKQGLRQLKETLQQQRERITSLEKELKAGQGDAQKLRTIIAALKSQIEQKDAQISDLLAQLEQGNIQIGELTAQVSALTQQTEEQQTQITQQNEVMQAQDQALNEGFIKIGTKQELKDAGLLSGGFMKKSKVDYAQVDRSQFQTVDIRQVTEIPIPSRSPKLLTPVPAGSYTLQQDGTSTTLVITDQTKFWSISNFLIIQTK